MSIPVRVLIIEDSDVDKDLLLMELSRGGYEPDFLNIQTADELIKALDNNTWDLILSDYAMPQFDGLSALRIVKERNPDVPFILISGTIGEDVAVTAMKAGVNDYIMKGNLKRLIPAISRELKEAESHRQRKRAEEAFKESEIRYHSLFDNSQDAILLTMPSGEILDLNPATCKMLGLTKEEIIKRGRSGIADLTDPRLFEALEERERTGKVHAEFNMIRGDGTKFPADVTSAIYTDANGRVRTSLIIRDMTERKNAEAALANSEEKFRAIFENVQDVFYQTDLNGIILEISPSLKHFAEFRKEDLIGKQVTELYYNPEDRTKLIDAIMEKGELRDYELTIKTKEGNLKYASINARLIYDAEGKPNHIDGAIRDITARKLAEDNLKENEERMRMIVEGTPHFFFYTQDTNADVTYISPSVEMITGYSVAEWEGQRHWFATDSEINIIAKESTKRHLKGEFTGEQILVEIRHANGSLILLQVFERPVIKNNKVIGLQGIAYDITQQKKSEIEINKLSQAVKQSPASIIITDLEGNIEYVNKTFEDITGYTLSEVIHKNPSILKSGFIPPRVYEQMWKFISTGISWRGELLNRKKNGELFWEDATLSPIKDENGKTINFLAVKQDITEKKKMTEELIAEKERAEKSDKLKTEFLAQMSHEIRTPTNAIISFSDILREDFVEQLPQELSSILDNIDSAGKRIIRTVDLILNSSEMQVGTYKPTMENIDLFNDVVDKVHTDFFPAARRKGLEFEITNLISDSRILGDKYSIIQIFIILVDNAVKYTEAGRIDLILDKDESQNVLVTVADTGIGISEEFLKNIFKPFMQEERGYSRRFEGNGLGLSLVKKYCDLNHANISVESVKGRGSKFTVAFQQQTDEPV